MIFMYALVIYGCSIYALLNLQLKVNCMNCKQNCLANTVCMNCKYKCKLGSLKEFKVLNVFELITVQHYLTSQICIISFHKVSKLSLLA